MLSGRTKFLGKIIKQKTPKTPMKWAILEEIKVKRLNIYFLP